MKINVNIYKLTKGVEEVENLAKQHRNYLKFIKENISAERTKVQ